MILTEFVMYRNKIIMVNDLSPTCSYKVQVRCPECNEIREVYYRSIAKSGNCLCHKCANRLKLSRGILVGSVFGKLKVVSNGEKSGNSVCLCGCGNIAIVANYNLRIGKTNSCGCLRSANINKVRVIRGGESHWNWQGGITGERNSTMSKREYKDWRNEVFERDNHTCKKCKQVGGKLNAHHIESYSENQEKRLDTNNGETLCEKCHKLFHGTYGLNVSRTDYQKFISLESQYASL